MPGAAPDLVALHDALACASTATVQAWRGDRDSASLSLLEAHVAAEEAFGSGSPEVEALNVVLAAITQAARPKHQSAGRDVCPPRPASDQSRLGQERTMTNLTTMNDPPAARSPLGICEPADLDLVRQALADASAWRAWKAEGANCEDCARLDPGRCADHAADDELAAAYEALLRRLATEGAVL